MSSHPASRTSNSLFWYFLIPGLTLYFHALAIDEIYRTLIYLNIAIIVVLAFRFGTLFRTKMVWLIVLTPLVLIIFNVLSGQEIALKVIRHLLSFMCITLGLLMLPAKELIDDRRLNILYWFSLGLVVSYALIQGGAVYLLGDRDGTPRNPHYLAQYCLLLLYVSAFLYSISTRRIKIVLTGTMILLALLLVNTGSRTAWLALLISGTIYYLLLRHRVSWKVPLVIAAGLMLAYIANLGGLKARTDDLAENITREERVTIWRNTVQMQLESTPRAWLFGHGIDSFKQDFKKHSQYHLEGIDFNAPHNHALEILYTSGILGLTWVAGLIFYLFLTLYRHWRRTPDSWMPATLIALLSANMLFGAITISFFSSYSLLIFSVVAGLLIHRNKSS